MVSSGITWRDRLQISMVFPTLNNNISGLNAHKFLLQECWLEVNQQNTSLTIFKKQILKQTQLKYYNQKWKCSPKIIIINELFFNYSIVLLADDGIYNQLIGKLANGALIWQWPWDTRPGLVIWRMFLTKHFGSSLDFKQKQIRKHER